MTNYKKKVQIIYPLAVTVRTSNSTSNNRHSIIMYYENRFRCIDGMWGVGYVALSDACDNASLAWKNAWKRIENETLKKLGDD